MDLRGDYAPVLLGAYILRTEYQMRGGAGEVQVQEAKPRIPDETGPTPGSRR